MNLLNILLQATTAQSGGPSMWIMLLLMIVIFYFFMIRPQSKKAKEELRALVTDKQAAFDMLVENYLGKKECGALDVTSRLQLQYFLLNPQINHLQTNGINGWWQNESYEPNEVAEGLEPVIDTTNNNGDGERLFSSFALKQVDSALLQTIF